MNNFLRNSLIKTTLILSMLFAGFTSAYSQDLYNTIQGKVWIENDNSVDGIIQTGERKLAGIVISMYADGDFQPKGNAMTDADGNYILENYEGTGTYTLQFDFPREGFGTDGSDCATLSNVGSDFTLNSRAVYDGNLDAYTCEINISSPATIDANIGLVRKINTITNCGMHSAQVAWPVPTFVDVLKIPSSLSMASTGATFWASTAVQNPLIRYENLANLPDDMELAVGVNARIYRADLPSNMGFSIPLTSTYALSESLPAYDGITDYEGESGSTLYNKNSSASASKPLTAAIINANYRGGGVASFPVTMVATTSITGGGNLSTQVTTVGSAGVCMIYVFGSNPLPVNLISFNASKDNTGNVNLNWVTAGEENNLGFDIEFSTDGKIWNKVDFIRTKSSNGTSVSTLSYNYLHTEAVKGINFYRLKQIDLNSKFAFSNVTTVNFIETDSSVKLFPNPIRENGVLNLSGLGESTSIDIYNMGGAKVYHLNLKNNKELMIDMVDFTPGMYIVVGRNPVAEVTFVEKVVK